MKIKFRKLPQNLKPSQRKVELEYDRKWEIAYKMALDRAKLRRRSRNMKSPNKPTIYI